MRALDSLVGALGLGLVAAGAVLRFTQPGGGRYWSWLLIAGLVTIAFFIIQRWQSLSAFAGTRSAREGANAAVLALVVLGIAVAVNYLANRHATQWDLTAAKQYTLSEQTQNVLSGLEEDITLVLLEDPGSPQAAAGRDLLELYAMASPKVSVELIDPTLPPSAPWPIRAPRSPASRSAP